MNEECETSPKFAARSALRPFPIITAFNFQLLN